MSNHASTLDDPAVVAVLLPWDVVLRPRLMRWSVCTQEICFETPAISSFFGAGKVCVCVCVRVWGGAGGMRGGFLRWHRNRHRERLPAERATTLERFLFRTRKMGVRVCCVCVGVCCYSKFLAANALLPGGAVTI